MSRQVLFRTSCAEALSRAEGSLTRAGFNVVRSFERDGLDASDCVCAPVSAEPCSCRIVVLLVFDRSGAPAVVTGAGRNGRFLLEVVSDPNGHVSADLMSRTEQALLAAPGAQKLMPA